jgi:hypothetical protein
MLETKGEHPSIKWSALGLAVVGIFAIEAKILLAVGQPFATLGLISLAVGAAGGFIMNRLRSISFESAFFKPSGSIMASAESARVLILVTIMIPEPKLARIDMLLPAKDVNRIRRQWILEAIDEKLARARTPDFPAAA